MKTFSAGDEVVAAVLIQSSRCCLKKGEKAKIRDTFGEDPQIVSVELPNGDMMIDIVIQNPSFPLQKK